jgi:hypothetical protein
LKNPYYTPGRYDLFHFGFITYAGFSKRIEVGGSIYKVGEELSAADASGGRVREGKF